MSDDQFSTLIGDLQYLVDELEALKYLIDVVPVYERPGDELSVCEHIRLIHFVQDNITEHINQKVLADSYSLEAYIADYKTNRSDVNTEKLKGVQHYINKLIHARVGLLGNFAERNPELDKSLIYNLTQLIRLERAIFKEMAEKVLAINKEA